MKKTKPKCISFTKAEVNQILCYIGDRDKEGWYYGNKEQFEKRQETIIEKLLSLLISLGLD